jgi:hypothetical protein
VIRNVAFKAMVVVWAAIAAILAFLAWLFDRRK